MSSVDGEESGAAETGKSEIAESNVLLQELSDGVLTLTLNRPEFVNALTWELMRRLIDALQTAAVDPDVRVVVLTGAGRGFCSGGHMRGKEVFDPDDPISNKHSRSPAWRSAEVRASQVTRLSAAPLLLHSMPKPTIAMLHGPAVGAGLCLAAACDMRISGESALFSTAFATAARSGDWGGSYLIPRLVGQAKARELYFFANKIGAAEALRIGLVNQVVPDETLLAVTTALASQLAEGPGAAYRYMKRNLKAGETMTLEEVMEIETFHMMRCSQTEDAREMATALKERRKPVYKGY